jgi:hypothetical protein
MEEQTGTGRKVRASTYFRRVDKDVRIQIGSGCGPVVGSCDNCIFN